MVDGYDVRRQGRAARQRIGYVPQELAFYREMTTYDMAAFYARLKGAGTERIEAALAEVGLSEHQDKLVGALSGGMKQRLALGLALLADPPVLVMDEPTSNLDTAARSQLLQLLVRVKQAGKTILFTSHRIEEIEALADEVAVMERGRLQFRSPAAELAPRLGLRTQVKFILPGDQLDLALAVLHRDGLAARRNGVGVIVEVAPGEKARPIHTLHRADIEVVDFEVE
jgi:ABC-type multidrug transport system ATPase subunit